MRRAPTRTWSEIPLETLGLDEGSFADGKDSTGIAKVLQRDVQVVFALQEPKSQHQKLSELGAETHLAEHTSKALAPYCPCPFPYLTQLHQSMHGVDRLI